MRYSLFMLLAALAAGCAASPPARPPDICLYTTGTPEPQRLILAVWADGRVMWSGDTVHGGKPLRCGRVEPAKVVAIVDELRRQFAPVQRRRYVAEGSAFIALRVGDDVYESWHEIVEENPRLVATATGVSALDAGTSIEVNMNQPLDYTRFRRAWRQARAALADLIPSPGQPCAMPEAFSFGRDPGT